ncbi:MAG: metallophosphoesterase family protein [Gammaproteobacteria bacterium]
MRVFAVSDIHADYSENLQWISSLDRSAYQDDVLILAGDVSDDMATLSRVLSVTSETFAQVLFVPGNHELWVQREDFDCSLEKFAAVMELCRNQRVTTEPVVLGGIAFIPLLGWYDYSFAVPGRELRLGWRDYRACR